MTDGPCPPLDSTAVLIQRVREAGPPPPVSGRLPRWARDLAIPMIWSRTPPADVFKNRRVRSTGGRGAAGISSAGGDEPTADELRRKGRAPAFVDVHEMDMAGHGSPLEEAIGAQAAARYVAALARLQPEEREAIIGRVEMEYSYADLAEVLGKPTADAARKAARRALLRLAEGNEGVTGMFLHPWHTPCHDSTHGCEALAAALCPDRNVDRPWGQEAALGTPLVPNVAAKVVAPGADARLIQLVSDTPTPERLRRAGHGSCSTMPYPTPISSSPKTAGHRSADGNVTRRRSYPEGEIGTRRGRSWPRPCSTGPRGRPTAGSSCTQRRMMRPQDYPLSTSVPAASDACRPRVRRTRRCGRQVRI